MMTWMEDSRPGKSNLGIMFCVESDVDVGHAQIIHLGLEK